MSVDKVELGRRLFYDSLLSANGNGSCASCHQQHLAFTDGRATAIGVTGERHTRSSMSLVNVAYNNRYTWASRKTQTLEQQIPIPLFNEQPVELGLRGRESALVETLRNDPGYVRLFDNSFPGSSEKISIDNAVKALASFVRSIISADSGYDRRLYRDDKTAMSEAAIRGMRLFFSDELQCSNCHTGRNFSGGENQGSDLHSPAEFHNTGLYNVAGSDRYPDADSGLRMESKELQDDGRFRAPTLRNIAVTAPYMHDGSIETLSGVLDHYAAGGRTVDSGDQSGDGGANLRKSPSVSGFALSDVEKKALLSFLNSLTDQTVLHDLRFADPHVIPGN